jgi:peptidoglycan hydrolase CwlO-like protein
LPYRYRSIRNSHITEEIKKTISTKQDEVKGAIITADKQLVVLENKLEELNLSSDDDDTATDGKAEALRQLEGERKALDASRKLLDELLAKAQEEAVANVAGNPAGSTTVTFGDHNSGFHNSGFQAGNISGGVSVSFGGKSVFDN